MKWIATAATVVCCCLFFVGIAAAQNAHFTDVCAVLDSENCVLTVNFKAAGLGNERVLLTLTDEVDFTCTTKGSGQETSAHQTINEGRFVTPRNGQVSSSISFTARCPGTQIESDCTFRDVVLTIGGISTPITNSTGGLLVDEC